MRGMAVVQRPVGDTFEKIILGFSKKEKTKLIAEFRGTSRKFAETRQNLWKGHFFTIFHTFSQIFPTGNRALSISEKKKTRFVARS